MKAASLLVFVLVCGCAVAAAQQASPASQSGNASGAVFGPAPTSTFVFEQPQACPVSLEARQSGMTDLVKVKKGERSQQEPNAETLSKPGQHIELIVPRAVDGNTIIGAVVTVRGLSARGRVARSADGNGAGDLRRTLEISFTPKDDKAISADLVLPGFTAVESIKLETLRYADGSSHDYSGQKLCTVAPNPLMLIAAH